MDAKKAARSLRPAIRQTTSTERLQAEILLSRLSQTQTGRPSVPSGNSGIGHPAEFRARRKPRFASFPPPSLTRWKQASAIRLLRTLEETVVRRPGTTGVNPVAKDTCFLSATEFTSVETGFCTTSKCRPRFPPQSENVIFTHARTNAHLHSRKHRVCVSATLQCCCVLGRSLP